MTTTLTRGTTVFQPTLVLGYLSTRNAENKVHNVIGRSDPEITFKAAGLRTGTLSIFCATYADALTVESMHAVTGVFTLTDDQLPGLNMRYVPSGSITSELDDDTRIQWKVSIDFQEVL